MFKQLAVTVTAALMLGVVGSVGTSAARIHQHQGIGPSAHHHGHHPR